MKKILIFLSMALIAMASCTKKDLLEVAYINALEGTTFTPAEVSALGDELTFSFNTNYQWQIRGYSTLGFCSVDLLKGDAGDATIKVKVAPNSTDAVRTAEFDILAGAAVQTVTITQTETNAIDIGTTSYTAPAGGGYIEIAVSANIDYTVNIPSEITWIRNAASTKAMESSFVMLEVDPNPLWVARSAEGITVTGKDIEGNDIVVPITVGQEAGGGVTTIWTKTFSADWNSVGTASPFHIAMRDGKLLMTDGKDVWAVDPVSGEYVGTVTVSGLTVAPQSMASDDGGNVLFAANATCGAAGSFVVYAWDGTSLETLIDFDGLADFWTGTIGNIRVAGNIDSKAVVSAVISGCNCFVAWQIENGTVTEIVTGSAPYINKYIGAVTNGVVQPVSDDISDGLLFIGYNGEYSLYYNGDIRNATGSNWTAVINPGGNGNNNYDSMSVVEYDGIRYCAVGQNDHFGYSNPTVYLFDITDMSNVSLAYTNTFAGSFTRVGADDVKLVVNDGTMKLYLVDAGYDVAACVEFPH